MDDFEVRRVAELGGFSVECVGLGKTGVITRQTSANDVRAQLDVIARPAGWCSIVIRHDEHPGMPYGGFEVDWQRLNWLQRISAFRLRPLFEPCDLWIGFFWDRRTRRLYFLPIPCVGIVIDFG
jgi:hypothetical protein